MVQEPSHILLARIAVPRKWARRDAHELELAFGVERMGDGGGREGTVGMQVEVAHLPALVVGPNSDLLAPVAFEWCLRVLEVKVVVRVTEVADFVVFHGWQDKLVLGGLFVLL